jgi:predicted ABC-type ATPase
MLREIATLVAADKTFALKTTLAGLTYARMISEWRSAGYKVKLLFHKWLCMMWPRLNLLHELLAEHGSL